MKTSWTMTLHSEGIVRLKKRAKSASREIDRLQADNRKMSDTIKGILGDREKRDTDTAIVIDSNTDALRSQLKGYIATIDRILEED